MYIVYTRLLARCMAIDADPLRVLNIYMLELTDDAAVKIQMLGLMCHHCENTDVLMMPTEKILRSSTTKIHIFFITTALYGWV